MKEKVIIKYNNKRFEIPLAKCSDCEDSHSICYECLKRSWQEACINAGQAKLLMGGEWVDDENKDLKTNQ